MMEIWKDIKGFEGKYQVSSLGRVRNLFSGKVLQAKSVNSKGYHTITLTTGIKKGLLIHRLVAIAFIENKGDLPQVNHKNGIKIDNRLENLEWCTASYNVKHAYDTGLAKGNRKGTGGGLGWPEIGKLKQRSVIDNSTGKVYESIVLAARDLGINDRSLQRRLRGYLKNNTSVTYL